MFLASKSSIQKSHYDILSVNEDASYDEIRAGYKAAVLDTHPDKLQGRAEVLEHQNHPCAETFLQVHKAWEVLADPDSRAVYDCELQASRDDCEAADEVKMEEMAVERNGDVVEFFQQCRCGDFFCVNSAELAEMGFSLKCQPEEGSDSNNSTRASSVVLPCSSCSLKIRLIVDINGSSLMDSMRH